ncbi:hypothetical protein AVEN_70199-1 [Araneus ventricosus]|uniref:Uncharacterized protein n=1 Tax=Araneus ventricosus TaxID=182803 RepID=A0A4Y2FBX7_ARAVE|nr:hypothetical protein AVEN_70199-1 [Araneus ventricosus]
MFSANGPELYYGFLARKGICLDTKVKHFRESVTPSMRNGRPRAPSLPAPGASHLRGPNTEMRRKTRVKSEEKDTMSFLRVPQAQRLFGKLSGTCLFPKLKLSH